VAGGRYQDHKGGKAEVALDEEGKVANYLTRLSKGTFGKGHRVGKE